VRSTGRWLLSAASLACQGAKLLLLLSLELGAFPVGAGLWLDFCALPLTSSSLGQQAHLLVKAPVMSAFMHWVIGVGFLLGFTFLVCIVREVLRPGALPFIKVSVWWVRCCAVLRCAALCCAAHPAHVLTVSWLLLFPTATQDPANPERNPVREMLDEPLLKHLGRVALSSIVYAGEGGVGVRGRRVGPSFMPGVCCCCCCCCC
jgi:E3 ubiquitin-protein ligase DOA10